VDEYWENMGGKPVIRSSKRKSDGDGSAKKRQRGDQPAVTSTSKSEVDNWDDAVEKVVTMEKTETGLILVYLDWYVFCSRFETDLVAGRMDTSRVTIAPQSTKSARNR